MKIRILCLLFFPMILAAAPKADLWEFWTAHDPASTRVVDHSDWDAILDGYLSVDPVSGIALFDYAGVGDTDRELLNGYIDRLEEVQVDGLNRREQMAYWINLYNALTVAVILDHWPVDSIREINLGGGGLFSRGPWDAALVEIRGRKVSLNDIEHRILRPIWKDPRIHYAVNCASIGCPDLRMRAFTSARMGEMLDAAARDYINHPRGVGIEGNTLYLSSIYDWFDADFGGTGEGVLRHILEYAAPALKSELAPFLRGEGRIRYRYDWSVNAG